MLYFKAIIRFVKYTGFRLKICKGRQSDELYFAKALPREKKKSGFVCFAVAVIPDDYAVWLESAYGVSCAVDSVPAVNNNDIVRSVIFRYLF